MTELLAKENLDDSLLNSSFEEDEEDAELTALIQRARAYTSEKKPRHRPLVLEDSSNLPDQATPLRKDKPEKKSLKVETIVETAADETMAEEEPVVETEETVVVETAVEEKPVTGVKQRSGVLPFMLGLVLGVAAGWWVSQHQDDLHQLLNKN
jgi:hypothetical protein